jgi:sarcosine oxidase subunit beta
VPFVNSVEQVRQRKREFENIVVGGGISGTAASYYLADAGYKSALIEQFDLNTQASGRNAGSLHGQIQFEAFHQLGMSWARSFLPALKFLADSLEIWSDLSSQLEVDLEVLRNGGLMVAEAPEELALLAKKVELEQSIGIESQLLTKKEMLEKAPYISQKMLGAAYSPIEGKANPLLAAPAFAAAAKRKGAEIFTGVQVISIESQRDKYLLHTTHGEFTCKNLVLTTNAGLNTLSKNFGLELPITNEPVQVSVSEIIAPLVKHLVYFAGEKLTFKQAKSGSLLIGGGWPAKFNSQGFPVFNPDSLRSNMRVALKVVPAISTVRIIRTWIGVGNGTPDQRPILGEIPGFRNAFIGMFPYMGLTAGPLLGKTLSNMVLNREADRDLSSFSVGRFS